MLLRRRLAALLCFPLITFCFCCQAAEVIPFEYRDGLIWVKVRTPMSAAPLNFVLDSGAGASVLNLQTARRLGVKLGNAEAVRRVGENNKAWRVPLFESSVAGIPVCLNPLALDLSETSEECSRTIDGLLGEDFFRGRIVEIDFKAHRIRLLDKANTTNCCANMPLKLEHAAMCVPLSVDGSAPRWTRLDTGSDDGLHWVTGTANGHRWATLQLGTETIPNVKTALHRSPLFPSEAGLLGNGVLSNYRVTIDGINRRLILARS